MRQNRDPQRPLSCQVPRHPRAKELAVISELLDRKPIIYDLVSQDLRAGRRSDTGRKGMTGEQVVRCAVLMMIEDWNYRELAFRLEDSNTAQSFSRIPFGRVPSFQTLQSNVKRIREATWLKIRGVIVQCAEQMGIEDGKKVRGDCTVVQEYTHHPTDSSLLFDCVRKLTELMESARRIFPEAGLVFHDHRRGAKRYARRVQDGKNDKERRKQYRKLIGLCERSVGYAQAVAEALRGIESADVLASLGAQARAEEIEDFMVGALGVIQQTWRRVINGERVPAEEKIVSIFEPHTDIIVKDRRGTQYGHKVFLSTGASGIITDCRVLEGNPADSTLLGQALERHRALFGRYPRQAAFDGGFASKANLRLAKSKDGIEDVAFAKKRGLDPLEMTKSLWVYRRLRNFRAGVEGCISALKRICGLRVCDWKGWHGFQRYVYSAVAAFNLLVMARRLLR